MASDDMEDIDVGAELATKAPESDAAEDKQKASTAAEQQPDSAAPAPAMGECCVSDRPTPAGAQPKGEIVNLGGVETYITKPASYPSEPARLLLLLSSGAGIASVNNQLQADMWAAKGFVVVMPDQFGGDPAPKLDAIDPEAGEPGFLDRLKLGFLETAKSFRIDMWLARHTPATVLPILSDALSAAEGIYADAVAFGAGIYGAGYCFGGRYALLLAGDAFSTSAADDADDEQAEQGKLRPAGGPVLKAAVLAHATGVTKDDFAALRPASRVGIAAVREDALFADEVREFGVRAARERGAHVEERVWDGVPHGFAVVGEYKDRAIVQAQAEAFDMMSRFLQSENPGPAAEA